MNKQLLCLLLAGGLCAPLQAERLTSEPIQPIEPATFDEPEKIELGEKAVF